MKISQKKKEKSLVVSGRMKGRCVRGEEVNGRSGRRWVPPLRTVRSDDIPSRAATAKIVINDDVVLCHLR